MIKSAVIFSLLVSAHPAFASSNCAQLKQELKAMQSAQAQIMGSLVNNHETFASSLEEYSSIVKHNSGSSPALAKNMDRSAQAFRARGIQGKKTAIQFNSASEDLLVRVAACLK